MLEQRIKTLEKKVAELEGGKKPVNKEDNTMTKDEVMAKLDELGIEHNKRDKKEVLIALLK